VMGEHGFTGFAIFMLLGWFTWNTGDRIRSQAKGSVETKWAADVAGMAQVSIVGYASAGAFLGLAYFDLYYCLIAIMVICSLLLKEQILHAQTVVDTPVSGVKRVTEQPSTEFRSSSGRS